MPDTPYDPFQTEPQEEDPEEKQPDLEDDEPIHFEEAEEESETYRLGSPITRPEISTPQPESPIEPLELDAENEEYKLPPFAVEPRERIENHDPMIGDSLISSLWYPLSGQSIRVLGLFTVLFWLGLLLPVPLIRGFFFLVCTGYAGILLLETAAFTLERIPQGPRLPDIGMDTLQIGMFSLTVMLIGEAPLMFFDQLFTTPDGFGMMRLLLLTAGGFFYLYYVPMGLMVAAQIEDVHGLNPILVFAAIGKMPASYYGMVTGAIGSLVFSIFMLFQFDVNVFLILLATAFLFIYILLVLMRAVAMVFRERIISVEVNKESSR